MSPLPDETTDTPVLSGQGDLKSDVRLLAYQVSLLDKKIDRYFEEIKTNYVLKSEFKNVTEDVAALKNNVTWLVRLVLGAVIVAIVGLVLTKGGVPH